MAQVTRIVVICDNCKQEVAPDDVGALSLVLSTTSAHHTHPHDKFLIDLCSSCFGLISHVLENASPYLLIEDKPPRKRKKKR